MPLNIIYQATETAVDEGTTALIGSDAAAVIRIVRPGISRKHAVASFDGTSWKVEDAGSRNGIFDGGERIQTTVISGPTTLYLGHPSEGEAISFVPITDRAAASPESLQDEIEAFVTPEPQKSEPPARAATRPAPVAAAVSAPVQPAAPNAEIAELTAALRDQISSVKGLTWSVWAMIAVTAVLAVMTLFVGVLGN